METTIKYFYRPLAHYHGTILKCAGIRTAENKGWFTEKCAAHDDQGVYLPGVFIIDGYRGDKIHADTKQPTYL